MGLLAKERNVLREAEIRGRLALEHWERQAFLRELQAREKVLDVPLDELKSFEEFLTEKLMMNQHPDIRQQLFKTRLKVRHKIQFIYNAQAAQRKSNEG